MFLSPLLDHQKSHRRRRSLDPIANLSHKEYQDMPLIWLDLSPNQLYYLNWAQVRLMLFSIVESYYFTFSPFIFSD